MDLPSLSRSAIPQFLIVALAAGMVAAVLFAPPVLGDGDSWWHLATGLWILDHRSIPYADQFSYTRSGQPWIAQEWLAQVLMAAAYRIAGWSGVMILFASAVAATTFLLGRHLRRWLPPLVVLPALIIALSLLSPSLLARPHLLALPVMELWCAGLVIARAEDGPPPLPLLLLMVLWANLHGSFPVGLVFAALLACEAALADARRGGVWFGFVVLACLATLINPNGLAGTQFPLRLIDSGAVADIIEWQPARLQDLEPVFPVLLLLAYLLLVRGFRPRLWRALILAGLVAEALLHIRNQMVLGIVGVLTIAADLGRLSGGPGAPDDRRMALPALAVALVALFGLRLAFPLVRGDDAVTPKTALALVPPALRARPVYNDAALGGYLIFSGVRPFIDGRAELYGADFMRRYQAAITEPGPGLARELEQYGVAWAIVATDSRAVPLFAAMPHWHRFYGDRHAVVFTRD
jgi:hypothetical protein